MFIFLICFFIFFYYYCERVRLKGLHEKILEELHERYERRKMSLLDEQKRNFGRMRDAFARDDQRLELVSIVFGMRNDDDTQQIHANFEDSIAVLNNEVRRLFYAYFPVFHACTYYRAFQNGPSNSIKKKKLRLL